LEYTEGFLMSLSIRLRDLLSPGSLEVFQPAGGAQSPFDGSFALRVEHVGDESVAIKHPDGGFVVGFSPVCTHMGCLLVRGDDDPNVVYEGDVATCGPCPCHGTTFDLLKQGLVVLGPATQNLPQLKLETIEIDGELHARPVDWFEVDPRYEQWPQSSEGGN
jgi:nitrite reductase/ring-hydroxylating ferredoxin subunit